MSKHTKEPLNLCVDHKQEWKQSHYATNNCDYCKLKAKNAALEQQLARAERTEAAWGRRCIRDAERAEKAEQQRGELVKALKYYAENKHWYEGLECMGSMIKLREHGKVAQEALAKAIAEVKV